MLTTFDTIEVLDPADNLPTWSTVWVGQNGCANRTVYYGAPITFTNAPTPTKDWYNTQTVRVVRSPKVYTGRRYKGAHPPFRYTPHQVSKITTTEHLVRRLHGSAGLLVYYQYGYVPKVGGVTCTPTITKVETIGPRFPRWNSVHKDFTTSYVYTTNGFDAGEIADAVRDVEDEAARDSLSSWDALTDLAELNKIPSGISSISNSMTNILRSVRKMYEKGLAIDPSFSRTGSKRFGLPRIFHMRPKDLLRNPYRIIRELGSLWMGYRYSIMPLVYSYRDIVKTHKRSHDVTTRAYRTVSPTDLGVSLPDRTVLYKTITCEGSIQLRASVFQAFSSAELARFAGTSSNLITTAWELIPMSWVVDWFLNVGDFLARSTGSTWSQTRWACASRRDAYTRTTSVHLPNQDEVIPINKKTPTNWWGSLPPTPPSEILSNPEGLYPLKTEEVDSYSRWLFDVTSSRLRLSPSLNWKRYLDSAVLSLNMLRALRRAFNK